MLYDWQLTINRGKKPTQFLSYQLTVRNRNKIQVLSSSSSLYPTNLYRAHRMARDKIHEIIIAQDCTEKTSLEEWGGVYVAGCTRTPTCTGPLLVIDLFQWGQTMIT